MSPQPTQNTKSLCDVMQEGEECSAIFMWGRGREGQLGNGLHSDSAKPIAVDELRGRRVLQVCIKPHSSVAKHIQIY